MIETHYDVLDVPRTATYEAIKISHRKLAMIYHPDKQNQRLNNNNSNNQPTEESSDAKFKRIQEAWECLRNPTQRRMYDDHLDRTIFRGEQDGSCTIVNLSEMKTELCEIEIVEDEEENFNDISQGKDRIDSLVKVYIHTCRCGDQYEVLDEDLDFTSPNKNVFQCNSCTLSIIVNCDICGDNST